MRRHSQTVRDISTVFKIDYIQQLYTSLNPEGHQNSIIGSKVIAFVSHRMSDYCTLYGRGDSAIKNHNNTIHSRFAHSINAVDCWVGEYGL